MTAAVSKRRKWTGPMNEVCLHRCVNLWLYLYKCYYYNSICCSIGRSIMWRRSHWMGKRGSKGKSALNMCSSERKRLIKKVQSDVKRIISLLFSLSQANRQTRRLLVCLFLPRAYLSVKQE